MPWPARWRGTSHDDRRCRVGVPGSRRCGRGEPAASLMGRPVESPLVPRGALVAHIAPQATSLDEVFGASSRASLGSSFDGVSIGSATVPALVPVADRFASPVRAIGRTGDHARDDPSPFRGRRAQRTARVVVRDPGPIDRGASRYPSSGSGSRPSSPSPPLERTSAQTPSERTRERSRASCSRRRRLSER